MSAEVKNLPAASDQNALVPVGMSTSLFFDVARFEHAQRVAKMLATSTMIPEHFRNNIGNLLIAMNLAERFQADIFMVMQNIYIVHGKPGIEAKLTIARINSMGRFTALRWKHENEGTDRWRCVCYAKEKATGDVLEADLTWDVVKKEGWLDKAGSKWKTMPKLMMQYRTATFFGRLYCPEATLGMMTADELEDAWEMRRQPNGSYAAPEPEGPPPPDFGARLESEDDVDRMMDFLEAMSAHHKVPVETIQQQSAASDEAWAELMAQYRKWCKKHPVEPPAEDTAPPPPPASDHGAMSAYEAEARRCDDAGDVTEAMQAALELAGLPNMPTKPADKKRVGSALLTLQAPDPA
jgi:hypothetical protein